MSRPLTIVVGGYIVGYPLGGMTWHHLNYLLSLHEMGHEVWFVEEGGDWCQPYNPLTNSTGPDSTYGRKYLLDTFERYRLPPRYCYYSEIEDQHYGLSKPELRDLLQRADLLLCVSGITPIRQDRPRPRKLAVIDTDPVFTQLRMEHDPAFFSYYRQFDAVATFGRLIGTAKSSLPTHGFDWIPTNQPVALTYWPMIPSSSRRWTTVGAWEHASERDFQFQGRTFRSSKSVQWQTVLNLPQKTKWELALGMTRMPEACTQEFRAAGWTIFDPQEATRTCTGYADLIRQSAGEFSVVKDIYAGILSGWFSDRSACYLASGRPVVAQSSGFDAWLPRGLGLFSFSTLDEATAALTQIDADYPAHAAAARGLAERFFDGRKVLGELLARIM
jgi:hypothetical protein